MDLKLTKENLTRCYELNMDSYEEQAQTYEYGTELYNHYMGMSDAFRSMIELLDDYENE